MKTKKLSGFVNACILLLLAVIITLALREYDKEWQGYGDTFSESLVIARVHQMELGQSSPGAFLGSYTALLGEVENYDFFLDDVKMSPNEYLSYTHQIGVTGTLAGALNNTLKGLLGLSAPQRLKLLYFAASVIFYWIALYACLCVKRELGWLEALFLLGSVIFAPLLTGSVRNLYWAYGLKLAPLAACLFLAYKIKRNEKTGWAYALFFVGALLELATSFEFFTNLFMLALLPLFYEALFDKCSGKRWLKAYLKTAGLAAAAFCVAFVIWFAQNYALFGNVSDSVASTLRIAASRASVIGGDFNDTVGDIGLFGAVWLNLFNQENTLFIGINNWVRLGITDVIVVFILAFILCEIILAIKEKHGPLKRSQRLLLLICGGFAALASWMLLARANNTVIIAFVSIFILCELILAIKKKREAFKHNQKLLLLVFYGFAASVSWMIIARAHTYAHMGFPVIWYFAFIPSVFLALGSLARQMKDCLLETGRANQQ